MGEVSAYGILVRKPEVKGPLRRPRRRWDNNNMDRELLSEGMDLIHLTQDRDKWRALVSTVMNLEDS
jgi:hypothetical protein